MWPKAARVVAEGRMGVSSMKTFPLIIAGIFVLATATLALAQSGELRIGKTEQVFTLDQHNLDARGLACSNRLSSEHRLFVLDRKNKIFAYRLPRPDTAKELKCVKTYDLSQITESRALSNPRGLAFAVENGQHVFYFLDWDQSGGSIQSTLWRYDVHQQRAASIDLTQYRFRIGDREPLDVACDDGRVLVSFDASGYTDPNLRVQRGIIEIQWRNGFDEQPRAVRHLPDSGTEPCRGLTDMEFGGVKYLWATVGDEHIYCAEAATGRGLFYFERPAPGTGLAFGDGVLWIAAGVRGPDRVYRVNVTKNPDAYFEGPKVPRRLVMTIQTRPETENPNSTHDASGASKAGASETGASKAGASETGASETGTVRHFYSRPCGYELLHRQGVWPETETVLDLSKAENATISNLTLDPAGDTASRQIMQCVEYASAPLRTYSSRYEIDMWTSPYKKFVYPHRANTDRKPLAGADYLGDDPDLYNLKDKKTYAEFVARVRSHIMAKYGVEADLRNPYWAARNVVEYIQDSYYYPNRSKRKPATVDYDRKHYDANPGNLKIELSDRPYDKTQIIACSGTSVMVTGAMRYLGIPARWLGTGTPEGTRDWDANRNGLLDGDELQPCTNGHRYTQVWLGSHYGWICFDATPSKPHLNDYDPAPPLQSQWRYMTRAAGGHRKENRIVFNAASELIRPLCRAFEYDEQLAIDNNCGGDQRYNLQGRFEKPELWKLSRQRIKVKNLCSIRDVKLSPPNATTNVTWQLDGPWDRIPDATLSIYLQKVDKNRQHATEVATLAQGISAKALSTTVDLSGFKENRLRLILRRDGDPLTGGLSEPFKR